MSPYDILIKNGIVVERGIPIHRPIALRHGFIVPCEDANNEAKRVIDARGYYVVPGLIDAHVHTFFQASDLGIPADLSMIPQGISTVNPLSGKPGARTPLRKPLSAARTRY